MANVTRGGLISSMLVAEGVEKAFGITDGTYLGLCAVLRAAGERRSLLILSPAGRAMRWLVALTPGLYERTMARSLRSELERSSRPDL